MKKTLITTLFFFFLLTACSSYSNPKKFDYLTIHTMNEISNQIGRNSNNLDLYNALSDINKPKKRALGIDILNKIISNPNSDYKSISDAEMMLGMLYERTDMPNEAFRYLNASAAKDNAFAQYHLAQLYTGIKLSNINVRRDDVTRVRYLEMAAKNNYPSAQFDLARSYASGLGVKSDTNKALYWWQQACNNNHQESCRIYDSITNRVNNYWLNYTPKHQDK